MNIGILRNTFLKPSETFIYHQMKGLKEVKAYPITREIAYKDYFDFNGMDILSVVDNKDKPFKQKLDRFLYTLTRRSSKIMKQVKEKDTKLIHAHFGVEGVYALPICHCNHIPLVTTFHGFDITKLPKFTIFPLSWLNYYIHVNKLKKTGDLFIAVSNHIKKKLISKGFPEEKIVVHYIGVDTERIHFKMRPQKEIINIIAVGRLTEVKGTKYLIRAFDKLYQENKNIRLTLIGDGPLKSELMTYVNQLTSKDNIIFKGQLKNSQVIYEMENADIFCMPSVRTAKGEEEGFGMVHLEAASTGLPIVAFNSGGIPEAIINEQTGFLAEEKNTPELAYYLKQLVDSYDLRIKMGIEARKNVETNFNLKKQCQTLEKYYIDLIKQHTKS